MSTAVLVRRDQSSQVSWDSETMRLVTASFEAVTKLAGRTKARADQFREADYIATNQPSMTPLVILQRFDQSPASEELPQFRLCSGCST